MAKATKKKNETKKRGPKRGQKQDQPDPKIEREVIFQEAVALGYSLDHTLSTPKLKKELARLKEERRGKPPCWRRAYSEPDPRCRICDLRQGCSGTDEMEKVQPEKLTAVLCEKCRVGSLRVELVDADENVVDYGCTTSGCTQTASRQTSWAVPDTRTDKSVTNEEIDRAILEYTRARGSVEAKVLYHQNIPGTRFKIDQRIAALRRRGDLRHRKKRGYYLQHVD